MGKGVHDAGVVHEDVDLAVRVDGAVEQVLDVLLDRHVAADERSVVAVGAIARLDFAAPLLAPPAEDDLSALFQKDLRDTDADASGAASDDRNLAFEFAHGEPPFRVGA